MTTGDKIRKLRIEKGMTQADLGEKLGVGKSAIAKYENNRVKNLKKYTIIKLSEIFEVSPDYLYANETNSKSISPTKDISSRVLALGLAHYGLSIDDFAEYADISSRQARELEYDSTELNAYHMRKFCDLLDLDMASYIDFIFDENNELVSDEIIINEIENMRRNTSLRYDYNVEIAHLFVELSTFTLEEQKDLVKDFKILIELKKHKNK